MSHPFIVGKIALNKITGAKVIEKDGRRFLELTDASNLFVGKKDLYLDVVLKPTPEGQYGDYMISESVSKEKRDAKEWGAILGNGNILNKKGGISRPPAVRGGAARPAPAERGSTSPADDEIPF